MLSFYHEAVSLYHHHPPPPSPHIHLKACERAFGRICDRPYARPETHDMYPYITVRPPGRSRAVAGTGRLARVGGTLGFREVA
jgi:hypothetical protein